MLKRMVINKLNAQRHQNVCITNLEKQSIIFHSNRRFCGFNVSLAK